MNRARGRSGPTLSVVVGAIVAFIGWLIGLSGLSDNSFLTHLATGRLVWDTHHIPRSDPYTFTAAGKPWVVQSWLASVLYGALDRLAGAGGLLVLMGALCALLAALLWVLTSPALSLLPRLAVIGLVVVSGTAFWSERPLTIGLLALAATMLCAEGRFRPGWLVPIFWIWVNSHGSFPLGLLALLVIAVGRRLDGQPPSTELQAVKWAAVGCTAATVNPLGPRLLLFPVQLVAKQDILSHVIEWQAPAFTSAADRAYLLFVVVAVVALVRRPSWRAALPLLVFLPLSLLSMRNIAAASIVIVPGTCSGLAGLGSITGSERRAVFRPAVATLIALAAVVGAASTRGTPLDLRSYPVGAVDYVRRSGLFEGRHRVATQDFVGNYLDLTEGPHSRTFVDDRFDMLPRSLLVDYIDLLSGEPGWEGRLDRYGVDVVLWERDKPLAEFLRLSPLWAIVYQDAKYVVARRR